MIMARSPTAKTDIPQVHVINERNEYTDYHHYLFCHVMANATYFMVLYGQLVT